MRTSPLLTKKELDERIPVVSPDTNLLNNPKVDEIQVTWIGHATSLVQMNGLNFLTDPIWSERCSPVQFLGRRCRDSKI